MSKSTVLRCSDCYFRHAGLCALPGDTPCPTFRAFAKGTLAPPQQAPLLLRPVPSAVLVAAAS